MTVAVEMTTYDGYAVDNVARFPRPFLIVLPTTTCHAQTGGIEGPDGSLSVPCSNCLGHQSVPITVTVQGSTVPEWQHSHPGMHS